LVVDGEHGSGDHILVVQGIRFAGGIGDIEGGASGFYLADVQCIAGDTGADEVRSVVRVGRVCGFTAGAFSEAGVLGVDGCGRLLRGAGREEKCGE
jgi:hypothetical protein